MNTMPRVSIIVLNWNGWKDTIECLESLFQITYPNYNIIIVDNASSDDSIIKIRNYCKGNQSVSSDFFDHSLVNKPVTLLEYDIEDLIDPHNFDPNYVCLPSNKRLFLIHNSKNDGFAEGNNIGIRFALESLKTDYILLLNNDTVVSPFFLDELIKVGETMNNVGVLSPYIYYYSDPEDIWFNKGTIQWLRSKIASHANVHGDFDYLYCDFISGCALLIKQEVLLEVGLLNSTYFLYFEDVEFSARIKKFGYDLVTVRKSKIYHKVSRTTNRLFKVNSVYYMHRNRIWFTIKYCPKSLLFIALANTFVRAICAFCYYETVRAHPCALAAMRGLRDGICLRKFLPHRNRNDI